MNDELDRLRDDNATLRGQLRTVQETVRALVAGEVDAVSTGDVSSPTLLRRAQTALRESEGQLRAVFEGALDAMLIANDEARLVEANPAAVSLFGVPREELLGRTAEDFTEDPDFAEKWRAFLEVGRAEGEFRLVRPDGGRRTLEFRAAARISPGRHLSVLRDVTKNRQLEEQLAQSHRLESIGRLAGGIAHDFNNMLSAIIGFAHFLEKNLPEGDPNREDVREILHSADRGAKLVRQLLAFGRRQMLSPRAVTAGELLFDVVRMTRRLLRADIDLVLGHGADDCRVRVDAGQIGQVLINLVLNARDAMPQGGVITMDAGTATLEEDAGPPDDDHPPPGEYCVISVSDTGVGMDRETQQHIFEPFFSTKGRTQGTGLGLATAYGIVKQSGGHIEAESRPGSGSTFRIYLPLHEPRVAQDDVSHIAPRRMDGSERILVVEDEAMVRRLVAEILRRHGYDVLVAQDPGEALLVFEQEGVSIDLLLTDVVMPRMSGPELADRIRAQRPELRVMFMSGYAKDDLEKGVGDVFLSKPFRAEELLLAVRQALESRERPGKRA